MEGTPKQVPGISGIVTSGEEKTERIQVTLGEVSIKELRTGEIKGTILVYLSEDLLESLNLNRCCNKYLRIRVDVHEFRFHDNYIFLIEHFRSFIEENPYPSN